METKRSSRVRAYKVAVELEQKEIQLQELNSGKQVFLSETDPLEKQILVKDIDNLKQEFSEIVNTLDNHPLMISNIVQ